MEATTLAVADSPTLSPEINEIRQRTSAIVTEEIIPNEDLLRRDVAQSGDLRGRIQERVKAEGLWAPTCRSSTAAWASASSGTPT